MQNKRFFHEKVAKYLHLMAILLNFARKIMKHEDNTDFISCLSFGNCHAALSYRCG